MSCILGKLFTLEPAYLGTPHTKESSARWPVGRASFTEHGVCF